MTTSDGTFVCDHDGCNCRVAIDETHEKSEQGEVYCSAECRDGVGCAHEGCHCGKDSEG